MNVKPISWFIFTLSAVLSIGVWFCFSYPQLALINSAISRQQAVQIAEKTLQQNAVNYTGYKIASVFDIDESTNRYLQKSTGYEKLIRFINQEHFDLFFWKVRFFKENVKEEYHFVISSATGEIISYRHVIDETASRKIIEREEALARAVDFLKQRFHFDPEVYTLKGDTKNKYDNRLDFAFSWHKTNINIPWSPKENSGTGKLLTAVTVSGDEILSYSKGYFQIPDAFNRQLARAGNISDNILTIIRIGYFALFTLAIYFILCRKNHLAMHTTKKFYIRIAVAIFILNILTDLNEFQGIIYNYNTTSSYIDYIWRFWINNFRQLLFFSFAFTLPALAGELLHYEVLRDKREGSFLFYLQSTFLSRSVTALIILGYFVCIILLGIQSLLIHFGQTHWGVWTEYSLFNNLSTAYLPFFSAIIFGFSSGIFEETFYRMYLLGLGKKYLKNMAATVFFASILWGFSHSGYPVFPMWFRGIEVSCLGIFMSIIYLNFGIIPVIVGHFLFNIFWQNAGFLMGTTQPINFYSTLLLLFIPLGYSLYAFIINKPTHEKPLSWQLNKQQQYNLEILKSYFHMHPEILNQKTKEQLKEEILAKGWDIAVVEKAMEETFT